jgi:hypothetical protein
VTQLNRISQDARHYLIVIIVFGITGSAAVLMSRLVLTDGLGLEGTVWAGPWSYRIAYAAMIVPFYSITLIVVGTVFGKREFFAKRVLRMWLWWLPLARAIGAVPRSDRAERHHDP